MATINVGLSVGVGEALATSLTTGVTVAAAAAVAASSAVSPTVVSGSVSVSPSPAASTSSAVAPTVVIPGDYTPEPRPQYHGRPTITGLVSITPKITIRKTSGYGPFAVHVSAEQTTYNNGSEVSGVKPWSQLDFRWDFGDASGTHEFTDWHARFRSETANANDEQQGGEACYVYDTPGTYTITLTAKGRDESGAFHTATTTSLVKLGEWEPYLGQATGGTYTITVDGQTTSAIAYDADTATLVSAVEALSTVGVGNVRQCDTGRGDKDPEPRLQFEFIGALAGQTLTVSANFGSLTGATGTPALIERQVAETSSQVTINTLPTGTYFDSNWGGTQSGTEAEPYATASQLRTTMQTNDAADNVIYIKRGSDFDLGGAGTTEFGDSTDNVYILDYGSGAKPIIRGSERSNTFRYLAERQTAGVSKLKKDGLVFRNMDFRRPANGSVTNFIWCYEQFGSNKDYPFQTVGGVTLIGCDYTLDSSRATITGITNANPAVVTMSGGHVFQNGDEIWIQDVVGMTEVNDAEYEVANVTATTFELLSTDSSAWGTFSSGGVARASGPGRFLDIEHGDTGQGFCVWDCNVDFGGEGGLAPYSPTVGKWFSMVGGQVQGHLPHRLLDHAVYSKVHKNILFRWTHYGPDGDGGACINNDCPDDVEVLFLLIDGNRMEGYPVVSDFSSNVNNNYSSKQGHLGVGAFQFNWCTSAASGDKYNSQRIGLIGYNFDRRVVRYNDFWNINQNSVRAEDFTKDALQEIYFNNHYGGSALCWVTRDDAYVQYNKVYRTDDGDGGDQGCVRLYSANAQSTPASAFYSTLDIDNNTVYNGASASFYPGVDVDTSATFTWAQWQSEGFDTNGTNADPAYPDASIGALYELNDFLSVLTPSESNATSSSEPPTVVNSGTGSDTVNVSLAVSPEVSIAVTVGPGSGKTASPSPAGSVSSASVGLVITSGVIVAPAAANSTSSATVGLVSVSGGGLSLTPAAAGASSSALLGALIVDTTTPPVMTVPVTPEPYTLPEFLIKKALYALLTGDRATGDPVRDAAVEVLSRYVGKSIYNFERRPKDAGTPVAMTMNLSGGLNLLSLGEDVGSNIYSLDLDVWAGDSSDNPMASDEVCEALRRILHLYRGPLNEDVFAQSVTVSSSVFGTATRPVDGSDMWTTRQSLGITIGARETTEAEKAEYLAGPPTVPGTVWTYPASSSAWTLDNGAAETADNKATLGEAIRIPAAGDATLAPSGNGKPFAIYVRARASEDGTICRMRVVPPTGAALSWDIVDADTQEDYAGTTTWRGLGGWFAVTNIVLPAGGFSVIIETTAGEALVDHLDIQGSD